MKTLIENSYRNMAVEEIIQFAKNEGKDLTIEYFEILEKEFEFRKLDKTILEEVRGDIAIAEVNQLLTIEKTKSKKDTIAAWLYLLAGYILLCLVWFGLAKERGLIFGILLVCIGVIKLFAGYSNSKA